MSLSCQWVHEESEKDMGDRGAVGEKGGGVGIVIGIMV